MKTVLFLFTIFILESFSDRKVYLIETEDDEGKTSGGISEIEEEKSREIEAGTDYGNDGPSPYGYKPKPYKEETTTPKKWTTTTPKKWTTTTPKKWTTTTPKKWTTTTPKKWTTTTPKKWTTTPKKWTTTPKKWTTTTLWKEKIKCVWSSWGSWSKGIKTCEETTKVRRRECKCLGGYGASAESYEKKECHGKKIQALVKKLPSCYVAPKPQPTAYKHKPESYEPKPYKPESYKSSEESKESYEPTAYKHKPESYEPKPYKPVRSYESSEESKERYEPPKRYEESKESYEPPKTYEESKETYEHEKGYESKQVYSRKK